MKRTKIVWLIMFFLLLSFSITFSQAINQLSQAEKKQEWRLLFDGKTSKGWMSNNESKTFPDSGWIIKDGTLTIIADQRGGDIVTTEQFSNFELSLEFKLTPGANSGIKYFIQPTKSIGCEYQILDDELHPDAKQGVNGNRTLASLYDLIPAENRPLKPIGEWNQARIIVNGSHVEHWLNGTKVIEYDRFSPCFRQLILFSKFKNRPNFGQFKKGHILFQDHGDTVSYRSIKIRNL